MTIQLSLKPTKPSSQDWICQENGWIYTIGRCNTAQTWVFLTDPTESKANTSGKKRTSVFFTTFHGCNFITLL